MPQWRQVKHSKCQHLPRAVTSCPWMGFLHTQQVPLAIGSTRYLREDFGASGMELTRFSRSGSLLTGLGDVWTAFSGDEMIGWGLHSIVVFFSSTKVSVVIGLISFPCFHFWRDPEECLKSDSKFATNSDTCPADFVSTRGDSSRKSLEDPLLSCCTSGLEILTLLRSSNRLSNSFILVCVMLRYEEVSLTGCTGLRDL